MSPSGALNALCEMLTSALCEIPLRKKHSPRQNNVVTWGWAVVCVGFSLPAGSATPYVNNLHNINSLLVVLGIYFVIPRLCLFAWGLQQWAVPSEGSSLTELCIVFVLVLSGGGPDPGSQLLQHLTLASASSTFLPAPSPRLGTFTWRTAFCCPKEVAAL